MEGYSAEIERQMVRFYESLWERDRRRYAAIEATKLGHGGVAHISRLLNCDAKTIGQGKLELDHSPTADELARQRKKRRPQEGGNWFATSCRKLSASPKRAYCWRSDESRCEMDKSFASTGRSRHDGVGNAGE